MATRNKPRISLYIGFTIFTTLAVISILSLFWLPYSLDDTTGDRLAPPSADHWFGTDKLGRDLLSRVIVGARIALTVGASSALLGGLIGISLGILAGYAQRFFDQTLASLLDILIAFPTLLLAMLIVAARGSSLSSAILAISFGVAAIVARLTRVLTKRVLSLDFITAARTTGSSHFRIVRKHVLPNIWPTLSVNLALQFGFAGLAEASLSYLGLGAPPPNASWGSLLQEAQDTVIVAPIGAFVPGLLLIALVLSVNFIADGLRDRIDPLMKVRS
jgi:peptide/nickel transport system permease protein